MNLNPDYQKMLFAMVGVSLGQEIMDAYQDKPVRGLRRNRRKVIELPFVGGTSELNEDIFIPIQYEKAVSHPYHHGGCYYIQDPTASMAVAALDVQANDTVLDLCAAPGGKTSDIADRLETGVCVSNEIDFKRSLRLVHNIERMGHESVVVTREKPTMIAGFHESSFDKVLVDAPCSGEGLYRKIPHHAESYNEKTQQRFQKIQLELLYDAYQACCNDGIIVYSTCTLNLVENEAVIIEFLRRYPLCRLEKTELPLAGPGFLGLNDGVARYYPSRHGEGHFIARIRVTKESPKKQLMFKPFSNTTSTIDAIRVSGNISVQGNRITVLQHRGYLDSSITIIKDGLLVGQYQKNYFEWHHSVALSVDSVTGLDDIALDLDEAYRYLYGHALEKGHTGWATVSYNKRRLGLVKGNQLSLNNRYPKQHRNRFANYGQ